MLSSVLHSERAVLVNVQSRKALVRPRELLSTPKERAHQLEELEKKYDFNFRIVSDAIRKLMEEPRYPSAPIPYVYEFVRRDP